MPICKLCLKEVEDTRKNSHILPHSLIKEAINLDGTKHRDKEFLFNFSSYSAPSRFQGRGVIPDALENLEIAIDKIEQEEQNPTAEDDIFCPDCEDRFGRLEGYFAEKILVPFDQTDIFSDAGRMIGPLRECDTRLIRLYVYGLFWRGSISTSYNFKMNSEQEEKLRTILDAGMDLSIETTKGKIAKITGSQDFPVAIAVMEKFEDPTEALIDINVFSTTPFAMIVGRYAFFLYAKEKDSRRIGNNLYGFSDYLKSQEAFNIREEKFTFIKIFKQERKTIQTNAFDFLIAENVKKFRSRFIYLFIGRY